jgi:hypothetical protein
MGRLRRGSGWQSERWTPRTVGHLVRTHAGTVSAVREWGSGTRSFVIISPPLHSKMWAGTRAHSLPLRPLPISKLTICQEPSRLVMRHLYEVQ